MTPEPSLNRGPQGLPGPAIPITAKLIDVTPPARMPAWAWAAMAVIVLALAGQGLLIYELMRSRPTPAPAPPPAPAPLVAAVRDYAGGLPATFKAVELKLRAVPPQVTTKAELVAALQAHAAPVATELDRAIAPYVADDKQGGKITNLAAVADVMGQVGTALGGK